MQIPRNLQWRTVLRTFRPLSLVETACIGITLAMVAVAGAFFLLPSEEADEPAIGISLNATDPNPMYREDTACIRWPTADCLFEMAVKKAAEPHPAWMIGQSRASEKAKAAKLRRVEENDDHKRKHFAVPRRFAKVAVCMARAGRTEDALKIVERHVTDTVISRRLGIRRDVRQKTILDMVGARARDGDLDGVRRILGRAKSTEQRLWILRRAGTVFAEADNVSAALKVYEMTLEELGSDGSRFATSSRAVLLGKIANAQYRAGNRDEAQAKADEMVALYARSRNADLHVLVSALLDMDEFKRARRAVTRFRENHYLDADRSTAAFVRYLAQSGHAHAAIREANQIQESSSKRTALYEIPPMFYRGTGRLMDALVLIPVVGKTDNNPANQASAVGAIAREIARTGDVAAALKLIDSMEDQLRQRSTFSSTARIFAEDGNVEAAELFLGKGNVRPSSHTEMPLIRAIARGGEIHQAIRRSLDFPVGIVTVEGLCSTAVEMASFSAIRQTWIRLLGLIGL